SGHVRNIEIRGPSHDCRSGMQVADQPDDCDGERDHKKQKNDLAVSSLFAQRTRTPTTSAVALVLRCHRDAESFIRSIIVWSLFRPVFFDKRNLGNKPLEFFESLTQLRFLSGNFFLPAAKRRAGLARTTRHRHHLPELAIQTKRARAMAPKIISGKLSATPIWNH